MFSFRALNDHVESRPSISADSSNHLSDESCITDCSLLSSYEKPDRDKRAVHDTGKASTADSTVFNPGEDNPTAHKLLSPNVLDLLHPSKKNTRESEEVRVIKLYRHALRLCSSENSANELSSTPLLESIVGSFLLKSNHLPTQLSAIKFATCKLLGGIYMKSKQNKRSMKFLIKAIELDRTDLTLWLRLARVSIRLAKFDTATIALDHILSERPSHPVALPLALPVYMALSEFEICLDLAARSLQLDPLNDRAIYCIQYVLRLQPNLSFLVRDLLQCRPDLLTEQISDCTRKQLDEEFQTLRSRYREQLDAQADSRKIGTVSFPEPLSSLTWPDLMESCISMLDRLLEESTLRSVLDVASLLPEEAIPKPTSVGEAGDGLPQATVVNPYACREQSGENETKLEANQISGSSSADPSAVPNPDSDAKNDGGVFPIKENVASDATAGANHNLAVDTGASVEPIEKRRSSRARPDVDLTDGLNRYRSRRGYSLTNESRPNIKSPGRVTQVRESKSKPLNRFRCAEKLRGLLPAIFRDLAKLCGFEITRNPLADGSIAKAQPSPDATSSITEPNKETDVQHTSLWSSEAVVEFIRTMHQMQPNIVTFGIALLLQVSQLHGAPWPVRLSHLYVSLSERLRPSLPRWCLTPSEYQMLLSDDSSTSLYGLLPIDVLGLRAPPSLEALSRLHLVYAELRLEQLECILSPNFVPNPNGLLPSDPRADSRENFLSTATVLAMVDVLSFHQPGSAGFAHAHAHYLWINYLLASIVQDYTEMEGYLTVLKDHLVQYNTSLPRNYSVYHGSLSVDHVNKLLNQLSGVSEFERLCRLSNENKHEQIVAEIALILEQRRTTRKESDSDPSQLPTANYSLHAGTCGHVKDIDLLSLLKSSLERLLEQHRSRPEPCLKDSLDAVDVESNKLTNDKCDSSTPSRISQLRTCYIAAMSLLENTSSSHFDKKDLAFRSSQSEDERVQLDILASSAINLLMNFWDLLANEYTASDPRSPAIDQSDDLMLVGKLPIRFDTFVANGQDEDWTPSEGEPLPLPECMISIAEVCRAVCICVDFIATRLETALPASLEIGELLTQRLITFVFEHLVCIEQSIPASLLPHPLRAYHECSRHWIDQIPTDLLQALYSGQSAAPPSLAWLHWTHELLARHDFRGESAPRCRERRDLLSLLRQLIARTAAQLETIVSAVRDKVALATRQQHTASSLPSSSQSDASLSDTSQDDSVRAFGSEDEFVQLPPNPEDDNTMACVDEMVSSSYQPWPADCVSLNQILAQAVLCLVPSSLFRQMDVPDGSSEQACARRFRPSHSSSQDRLDAPGSEDEASPIAENDTMVKARMSNCMSIGSDLEPVCVTPEWIQHVNRLLTERHWCSHVGALCSGQPAWWLQQVNKLPDSVASSEEIKLLDWVCIKTVFEFCYPTKIPDYDSVKTLSVSNELLNLLLETIELIPRSEQNRMLTTAQVEDMLRNKAKDATGLVEEPTGLSSLTRIAFYLIADYYMKNNNFERAIKYYLEDLRACPRRSNTWAALGLIYYSELEQIINLTNLKTERVSPDAVARCLRCFAVAINLMPYSVTLLIERGCLAYQLHAYAARVVKKASSRSFPDAHLNLCRKWRSRMLQLARSCYEHVLSMRGTDTCVTVRDWNSNIPSNTSQQPMDKIDVQKSLQPEDPGKHVEQAKDEEWLCRYMLSKCSEKEATLAIEDRDDVEGIASYLLSILRQYEQALKALDTAGAKYPKKVIVYHKLPFRAVEAIEVFYRIHALTLKTLLNYGPPDFDNFKYNVYPVPLVELQQFLKDVQSSEFVASCGKPRRGKKRTATSAGLTGKQPPTKLPVPAVEFIASAPEGPARSHCVNEDPSSPATEHHADPVAETQSLRPNSTDSLFVVKPVAQGFSSQDEFIDLISPGPPTPEEDEVGSGDPADSILRNPQALWQDCVDRCRVALELVLQRLPLHYKAMYRLADLYLRAPHIRDPLKALSILLGPVDDSYKSTVGGLFKDRKQNNFFHGVWRIPTPDIDRSGNFAAHMFRSVSLTLDTLSERGDWRHLVHIFHQLRKQPPEEKRGFLGEGDRVYLARRAFNLIQPTLLIWLTQLSQSLSGSLQDLFATVADTSQTVEKPVAAAVQSLLQQASSQSVSFINLETLTQIYRLHCVSYSRNCQPGCSPHTSSNKEPSSAGRGACTLAALEVSGYAEVLQIAYRLCPSAWDSRGPHIDLSCILQRCTDLTCSRSASPGNSGTPTNRSDSGRAVSTPH